MTTAYQNVLDNNRVSPADPFDMGAGHIRPGGEWTKKNNITDPGLVYDAGFLDYLGFMCEEAPEVFGEPDGHLRLPGLHRRADHGQEPELPLDRRLQCPRQRHRDAHGHRRWQEPQPDATRLRWWRLPASRSR